MKGIKQLISKAQEIGQRFKKNHIGAYAAQAAFYFVLCLIPVLLLLMTLIQFTPVTQEDVMAAAIQVLPAPAEDAVTTIVMQVYSKSKAFVPVTAIGAIWLAGRGVLSITQGLNNIYDNDETRNYFILRVRSTLYTVLFILILVLLLVLSVFGSSLHGLVEGYLPWLTEIMENLLQAHGLLAMPVLLLFSLIIYQFLPNHKTRVKNQLPGAIFTTVGWIAAAFIFSKYLDIFRGFSDMYGSLTVLILLMLWVYFCMYTMLLGGELNILLVEYEVFRKAGDWYKTKKNS